MSVTRADIVSKASFIKTVEAFPPGSEVRITYFNNNTGAYDYPIEMDGIIIKYRNNYCVQTSDGVFEHLFQPHMEFVSIVLTNALATAEEVEALRVTTELGRRAM